MRTRSTSSSLLIPFSTLTERLREVYPLPVRYLVPSLALLLPGTVLAQPTISSLSPTVNASNVDRTSPVQVTFNTAITTSSAPALKVFSSLRGGLRTATVPPVVSGSTLTFTPSAYNFQPGETLLAVVTTAVTQSNGTALAAPYVYQFTTATTPGTGTFGTATNYTTATGPESVAVGDLNGDGIQDMVTANNGGTISVLLGQSTGGFAAKTDYTLGSYPAAVVTGDVNGDGRLDVVVGYYTNPSASTVSVLLGQANGTLAAKVDYTSASVTTMALGDLNGDGRLDLVTGSFGNSNVSVLLGLASGGFGTKTDYAVTTSVRGVAVGDLNGDGRLDLVATNNGASTVSVRLGQGNGTFGANTTYTTGTNPYGVALGDVNNDGRLDIVTGNGGASSVSVLLGQASGFAAATSYPTKSGLASVALGDVNGDGLLDIAAAAFNTSGVSVLLGQTGGTFAARTDYADGTLARGLVLGDMNGDGRLDLITSNQSSNTASVLLSPTPLPVELVTFTAQSSASAVHLQWATASELNAARFEVERSSDGVFFTRLASQPAAGTNVSNRSYTYLDTTPLASFSTSYYRLRQVDHDGSAHYSPVRMVNRDVTGLTLFPSPAHESVTLTGVAASTPVQMLDALGRVILTTTTDAAGTASLALPTGLPAGVYVVRAGSQATRLTVE